MYLLTVIDSGNWKCCSLLLESIFLFGWLFVVGFLGIFWFWLFFRFLASFLVLAFCTGPSPIMRCHSFRHNGIWNKSSMLFLFSLAFSPSPQLSSHKHCQDKGLKPVKSYHPRTLPRML